MRVLVALLAASFPASLVVAGAVHARRGIEVVPLEGERPVARSRERSRNGQRRDGQGAGQPRPNPRPERIGE